MWANCGRRLVHWPGYHWGKRGSVLIHSQAGHFPKSQLRVFYSTERHLAVNIITGLSLSIISLRPVPDLLSLDTLNHGFLG